MCGDRFILEGSGRNASRRRKWDAYERRATPWRALRLARFDRARSGSRCIIEGEVTLVVSQTHQYTRRRMKKGLTELTTVPPEALLLGALTTDSV